MKRTYRHLIHSTLIAVFLTAFAVSGNASLYWQQINISGLPPGTALSHIWERNPNEVYVWGQPTNSTSATLYHWDGTNWTTALSASGQSHLSVFGVGSAEVFAATTTNLWRSADNGKTWNLQTISVPGSFAFLKISGTTSNVQVIAGSTTSSSVGYIYRFDGSSWASVFSNTGLPTPPYSLDVIAPNEGYFITCWGWGAWNGSSWSTVSQGFDFCDVDDTWAMRDAGGNLHWWAVGNNNFANGIHIWCFDTATMSFGCKTCYCYNDGNTPYTGGAYGIWGSDTNDVYVIGDLASVANGPRAGRVYHFDGSNWSQVTSVGNIHPNTAGIWGTSSNDVWIAGSDGVLLHSLELATMDIHMYAGLSISGSVGATYEVQYSTKVNTNNWQPLANIVLPTSPYLFFDTNSPSAPQRFYRTVLIP